MLTMSEVRGLTDRVRRGEAIGPHEAGDCFDRLLIDLQHCARFLMDAEYAESLEALNLFVSLPAHAGRLRLTPAEATGWSAIAEAGKGLSPFGVREHFPLVFAFWADYRRGPA